MKWMLKRVAVRAGLLLAMTGLSVPSLCAPAADAYAGRANALVRDYVREDLFSGVVLVAKNGRPVFRQGFGAANREWAIANTTGTRFHIGSITKQFTAAAIMRLVDEHKLALDDAIGKYVQDLPASWQTVTLRQLLQHSSGIPRYTALDEFDDTLGRIAHTPRQIIDLVKTLPLEFAPGTQFRYDNTGYVLLGCVIEAVSGLAYRDYLEQKLLKPLGLANTGYSDGRRILARAAQGYTDGADGVRRVGPVDMSNVYAAGAMYASAGDLLAWQQKLTAGQVLGPDSTAAMFTDGGHHYGLGWYIQQRFGRRVIEHGGSLNGFNSMLAYYPDDGLTVIVLGNLGDMDVVEGIADGLARLALGVAPAHREVEVDPRSLPRIVGRYQLAPALVLTISRKGRQMSTRLTGQRELNIYPEGAHRYFLKAVDAQLEFDDADPARAGYVILHQNGQQMKAPRID
jgi:CubicO group peptidase (beta-lactamase class C family)